MQKRSSLHKRLETQQDRNAQLMSHVKQLQPLANIGTISAIIAHEINNILTPLGSYAQLALKNPDDNALKDKALQKVVHNSRRASEILESILGMANGESQLKKRCLLSGLVDDVFTCMVRDFSSDGINAKIDIDGELAVFVIPVQFQQVLMNLILNARKAMLPGGGVLNIKARNGGESTVIEISDTGCGIKKDDMENIFQPFFTTRTADSAIIGSGAGLGLVFCKEIIEAHEGYISVKSEVGAGTTFEIVLPCRRQAKGS